MFFYSLHASLHGPSTLTGILSMERLNFSPILLFLGLSFNPDSPASVNKMVSRALRRETSQQTHL